jgi:hypothetical protein
LNVTKKGPQMKLLKLVESAAEYVRGNNVASVASPGGGLWDGAGRSGGSGGVVGTISNTSSAADAVVLGSLSSSGGSPNDQQRDGYSSALGMLRSTEDLRMPTATTAIPIAGSSSGAFLSVPLAGSPLLVEDSQTLMRDWFGDHAIGAFTPSLTSPYSEVFGAASAAAGPENAALLSTTVGMALEQSNNSLGAAHQLRASTGPGATPAAAAANPAAVAAAAAAAAASVGASLVGTTLFVFGIPAAAMIDLGRIRDFLRQHFERFGQLANVEVTHGTNGWPSSALVEFGHKDSAAACMREVDAGLPSGKIIVDGHSLVIRWWQATPARFDGDNNAVYSPRAGDDAKSPPQQPQQQSGAQQQSAQQAQAAPQAAPATQQQKPTLASHLAMAKKAGLNGSTGGEGTNAPLLAAPPVAVPPSPSAGSNGASNAAADGDDEDDGDSQQTDSLNNSTDFVGELDGSGGAGFPYNGEAFSNASTDFTQGPPHLRRRRALQQLFNELVRRDAHCVPEDHEILTEFGFMDLAAYEARVAAGASVRIASYDALSEALLFQAPLALVVKPSAAHTMVELSHADDMTRTWAPDSNSRDMCETPASSGVSVLVTDGHDLYARCGPLEFAANGTPRVGGAAAFEKIAAADVVFDSACDAVQQIAVAASGVAGALDARVVAALGLDSRVKVDAFLELYGFFLCAGSLLTERRADGRLAVSAIAFESVKQSEFDWLCAGLPQLLAPSQWRVEVAASAVVRRTVVLVDDAWVTFFAAEYAHKYCRDDVCEDQDDACDGDVDRAAVAAPAVAGGVQQAKKLKVADVGAARLAAQAASNVALRAAEPVSAALPPLGFDAVSSVAGSFMAPEKLRRAKWCAQWVWTLGQLELQRLVAGMQRASGGKSGAIRTASARFRDEVLRVLLMAGYAARFRCEQRCGATVRGAVARHDVWCVCWSAPSDAGAEAQSGCFPSLFKAGGEIRKRQFTGRVWCFTMPAGFIWARRAAKDASGAVVKASRALLLGNCAPHHHPCSAMAAKRIFAECTGLSFEDALQLQFFDVVKAIEACPDLFSISYVPDGREGINEKKWRFRANWPVKPRKPSTRVRSSVQSKTGGTGSKTAGSGGANGGSGGAGGGSGGKQQPTKQREPWE